MLSTFRELQHPIVLVALLFSLPWLCPLERAPAFTPHVEWERTAANGTRACRQPRTTVRDLGFHARLGLSYDAFSLVQFGLILFLLLVPTTLMGGTLPVSSQALA
jgi:hypothetical protein